MKILHTVEFYYPSTGGMQEVVKQLSERLAKTWHDVTVATQYNSERKKTVVNGVKIEQFRISGNAIRGYEGRELEIKRYKNFLIQSDFDIITNFAAQQWATDLVLPILDKTKTKKVFVPTGFSGLYLPEYREYFEEMKCQMKKYDMNIFFSGNYRDMNFAKENRVKKRVVIPGGAAEEEFLSKNNINIRKKLGIPQNHFLILLVGSHTGAKGHQEAIEIFRKSKIENATLLIIGNSFGGGCIKDCSFKEKIFNLSPQRLFDKKKLLIVSLVRQETINAYKQADLFLFPSNIECSPLVLFECMASKTPFLVTDVGNSKEIIAWSKSGLLLPTVIDKSGYSKVKIDESIKILENICRHPPKRLQMAESGFTAWKKKFTWGKIIQQYEQVYQQLVLEANA